MTESAKGPRRENGTGDARNDDEKTVPISPRRLHEGYVTRRSHAVTNDLSAGYLAAAV